VLANRRFREHAAELSGRSLSDVFTYIYDTNMWGAAESRSGLGSELDATAGVRQALPPLLRKLKARALLDIPCGDFRWLSQTDLGLDEYVGADIVAEIVRRNQDLYGLPGQRRRFIQIDLTKDALPRADVVLCRDCLVHFSDAEVFRALANLKESGSRYLLATTFVDLEANADIVNGDWRPLNLQKPPFCFPDPLSVLLEGCTEEGGAYADKALAVWEMASLPESRL
jgi:hypothetical protein